jgi:hypothetical protein
MSEAKLVFRVHAINRMFERSISVDDVKEALLNAEVVMDYPTDKPYPSRLLLGWASGRPLHMVVAENPDENERIVITVYEPDSAIWESDFRRRTK